LNSVSFFSDLVSFLFWLAHEKQFNFYYTYLVGLNPTDYYYRNYPNYLSEHLALCLLAGKLRRTYFPISLCTRFSSLFSQFSAFESVWSAHRDDFPHSVNWINKQFAKKRMGSAACGFCGSCGPICSRMVMRSRMDFRESRESVKTQSTREKI